MSITEPPKGVGGWLAFLIITLMVTGPLLALALVAGSFSQAENAYPGLRGDVFWESYTTQIWILVISASLASAYGGYKLWKDHQYRSVALAIYTMWGITFTLPIVGFLILAAHFPKISLAEVAFESIGSTLISAISAAVWTLYLKKSKRVKNTYLRGVSPRASEVKNIVITAISPQPKTTQTRPPLADMESAHSQVYERQQTQLAPSGPNNPSSSNQKTKAHPQFIQPSPQEEEHAYELASLEIENASYRKGLWMKLWTEANGDETKVKINYIKIRVSELLAELHQKKELERNFERNKKDETAKIKADLEDPAVRTKFYSALKSYRSTSNSASRVALLLALGGDLVWDSGITEMKGNIFFRGSITQISSSDEFANWFDKNIEPILLTITNGVD